MNEVVFNTLKEKDFIVKNYIIKVATELKLSLNETLLLIYFSNQEVPTLNIENITSSLYLTQNEIMESFSRLIGINLITVNVIKNDKGIREEVISLDNILKSVTNEITKKHKSLEKDDLYKIFEREFSRPISSMECEIITEWLNSGYSKELIIEALRDSIYNGYRSFKSISSKLEYWREKGYKNKKDISEGLKNNTEDNILTELFDYNYLDEE